MEITAEVGMANSRQCSHSTDTVSSSQQPTAVPVEKNDQSSQSTAAADMPTLQVDGIVGLPTSGKVCTTLQHLIQHWFT